MIPSFTTILTLFKKILLELSFPLGQVNQRHGSLAQGLSTHSFFYLRTSRQQRYGPPARERNTDTEQEQRVHAPSSSDDNDIESLVSGAEELAASSEEQEGILDDYAQMMTTPSAQSGPSDRSWPKEDDPHVIHERSAWKRLVLQYRVSEFACTAVMFGFSLFFSMIEVQQRDIPRVDIRISMNQTVWARAPSIDLVKGDEHVPMAMLVGVGCGLPVITNLFLNYVLPRFKRIRVIPHDTRDFLLSLFQSAGLSALLTQFTKNMTGRFRPCFYNMCGWDKTVIWDGVTNLCTSAKWEKEARKSFPSGHASFAWSTMLVLTLYLLGRSRLNCENRSHSIMRGGRKSLKLFVCFIPSFFAAWVAVTRSIDNWHHYSDILAGSIIGAVAATIGYGYNYGSVFSWESAGVPYQEYHNRRKVRMHVLRQQRQQLLQKQVSTQSGADTISSLTTSLLENESDILKDRELLEVSGSNGQFDSSGGTTTHSALASEAHLNKPLTSHGEYVINVSSNGSVSAGASAIGSSAGNHH